MFLSDEGQAAAATWRQDAKKRKPIPPEVRKSVWETHMANGLKEGLCPICKENVIKSNNTKAGFECAHILPDRFYTGAPTPLFLYPSCSTCNSACEDDNLLDYLYQKHKWAELKRVIKTVCNAFITMNPDLSRDKLAMWKILEQLYGYERWPMGGGIVNESAIYHIARAMHMEQLAKKIDKQTRKLQLLADEMRLLGETPIQVKRPRFV